MKHFSNVAIVGVGLIGGSIGMAIRSRGLADRVIGIGRRQETLRTARRVGAVDNTTVEMAKGVAEAELIVVCTPVGRVVEDIRQAAKHCPRGTLITDAGSTKASIVAAFCADDDDAKPVDKLPRGCRYLGSHPLAGGEQTGPAHASADLFEGRVTVVTPDRSTLAEDFDLLESFWTALGSMVIKMPAAEHDRALAITSHMPHAVAAALAASVSEELFRLVGAGFLDTTRIAAGGADIWKQIFMLNRDNVLEALSRFKGNLAALETAIRDGDEAVMERILTLAKNNRDALGS